jgi:hypothetical protein
VHQADAYSTSFCGACWREAPRPAVTDQSPRGVGRTSSKSAGAAASTAARHTVTRNKPPNTLRSERPSFDVQAIRVRRLRVFERDPSLLHVDALLGASPKCRLQTAPQIVVRATETIIVAAPAPAEHRFGEELKVIDNDRISRHMSMVARAACGQRCGRSMLGISSATVICVKRSGRRVSRAAGHA